MSYENNNKVFTVVIRCAFVDGHLGIKEEVITRFEMKWRLILMFLARKKTIL